MKKQLFFILFFVFPVLLFSEELQFIVLERCKYILSFGVSPQINYLEKDSIITCRNYINYSQALTETTDLSFDLVILLLKDGNEYWAEAEKLLPLNTTDAFSPDIAINHSRDNKELWVPSYYADVLSSRTRDTLIGFESYWLPWEIIDDYSGKIAGYWYTDHSVNYAGEIIFYNAAIRLSMTSHCLMIKDIQKTDYGYQVICMRAKYIDDGYNAGSNFNWSYVKDDEYFTLIIKEDGDYLDLYVDNYSQKFGTLIKVKQEFAKQFELLIKTNSCDLTNVQWPRRADGSMDYSPPEVSDNTPAEQSIAEPVEITSAVENQEKEIVQNNISSSTLPLWAWVAIIGGAVVIGGVVFVVKRKK